MVGMKQYFIEFDSVNRSYFPGEEVKGRFILIRRSEKLIEGMKVILAGAAIVRLSRDAGSPGRPADHLDAKEKLVELSCDLIADVTLIRSGRNVFPFTFTLPMGLPSSFYGAYGAVMYSIMVDTYRANKPPLFTQAPFTVNAWVDLNTDIEASKFLSQHKVKQLYRFYFFSNGSIGLTVELKQRGAVPGEYLDLFVSAVNNSNTHQFAWAEMSLFQTSKFCAKGCVKDNTIMLSSLQLGSIHLGGENHIFVGNRLKIPAVPPTGLGGCAIIDVWYWIEISLKIPGTRKAIKIVMPITIGTVPFKGRFNKFLPTPETAMNSADVESGVFEGELVPAPLPSSALLSGYHDLPLVTFVQSRGSVDEKRIEKFFPSRSEREEYKYPLKVPDFQPKYVYYTFYQPPVVYDCASPTLTDGEDDEYL